MILTEIADFNDHPFKSLFNNSIDIPHPLFPSGNFFQNLNDYSDEETTQKKKTPKFILNKDVQPTPTFLKKKLNSSNNSENGRWTKDEQKRFAEAVFKYGTDWRKIQEHVFSRNMTQVRSHAQKYLMKLKENKLLLDKGLDKNYSWNKVVNFIRNNFTNEELKNILFTVEDKKRIKNYVKSCKKNENKINNEENNYILNNNDISSELNFDEERKEKEILESFIKCFTSNSNDITLNTSFEDFEDEENNENYFCSSQSNFGSSQDIKFY